ncbi:MAG TPA: hypothetical protein VGK85_06720 [Myxococcaceae bacterium]
MPAPGAAAGVRAGAGGRAAVGKGASRIGVPDPVRKEPVVSKPVPSTSAGFTGASG